MPGRHSGFALRFWRTCKQILRSPLIVPDTETTRVQECHIALAHVVLGLLEEGLLARTSGPLPATAGGHEAKLTSGQTIDAS